VVHKSKRQVYVDLINLQKQTMLVCMHLLLRLPPLLLLLLLLLLINIIIIMI
jgi:hypothetical protein